MSLARVKLCYAQAGRMAGIPYVYGGNHGNTDFRTAWRSGVDCSSGASVVLSAGGLLAHPRAEIALDTEEFEAWGLPGVGAYLTLYVYDAPTSEGLHHCALRFDPAVFEHEWWQAANATDGVGWITFDPAGFNARHWSST